MGESKMLLITETNFTDVQSGHTIDEATGQKKYSIQGVFLQAEQKNRNGRVYPASILEREVARYTSEYINNKRSMGELNHPKDPAVNPERACHLVESLTRQGDNWIGRSKVLSTPKGMIVRNLLDDGVQLGVSSRGLGTITERSGVSMVNEDYYMNCIDVVSDPSAHEAWVNGIFEGKEFYMGDDEQFIEKVKKHIDKEARKPGFSMVEEKVVLSAFQSLLERLS